jgi:hypothetical protein
MPLSHSVIELNTSTPELLSIEGDTIGSLNLTIQNLSSSASVFLGSSSVTSSDFAFRLDPGSIISFDSLRKDTEIYGISNTNGESVAVGRFTFS